MAVVEEAAAVECVEEIAATPGLDAIFIGTSDLSFSYGLRGKQDDPRMTAAVERIVAAARANNKPVGRPASSAEQVAAFRAQGFSIFQVKTELGFLAAGARDFLGAAGRAAARAESKGLY
jgi:2-keto-3-deoxy-L-rhamnonate aldolase RhmA